MKFSFLYEKLLLLNLRIILKDHFYIGASIRIIFQKWPVPEDIKQN